MEFKDYVRMVLAHWVGVVVLIALGVLAAVAYNQTQPAVYEATATGYVTLGRPDPKADPATPDERLLDRRLHWPSPR